MNKPDWTIPPTARDWESDWEGDTRFHLRYFHALPLPEKVRIVEQMAATVTFFDERARKRRRGTTSR